MNYKISLFRLCLWTLVVFIVGVFLGEYTECRNDGSTGPGYAPYADKASP
jgi:hypothetical protein